MSWEKLNDIEIVLPVLLVICAAIVLLTRRDIRGDFCERLREIRFGDFTLILAEPSTSMAVKLRVSKRRAKRMVHGQKQAGKEILSLPRGSSAEQKEVVRQVTAWSRRSEMILGRISRTSDLYEWYRGVSHGGIALNLYTFLDGAKNQPTSSAISDCLAVLCEGLQKLAMIEENLDLSL